MSISKKSLHLVLLLYSNYNTSIYFSIIYSGNDVLNIYVLYHIITRLVIILYYNTSIITLVHTKLSQDKGMAENITLSYQQLFNSEVYECKTLEQLSLLREITICMNHLLSGQGQGTLLDEKKKWSDKPGQYLGFCQRLIATKEFRREKYYSSGNVLSPREKIGTYCIIICPTNYFVRQLLLTIGKGPQ